MVSSHPSAPPVPRTPRRRAGLAALALTAGLLAPVAAAAPASAHDALRSTNPADGTTVDTAPDAVELEMSSTPLGLGTQVQVTGPAGVVSTGDAQVVDTTVSQALLGDRPAGEYTVQWRVTSSDGHPVSGSFTFTSTAAVGTPAPTATPTTATGTPTAEPSTTSASPTTDEATADDAATTGSSSGLTGAVIGLVVVLVAAVALGALAVRRRRNR